MKGRSFHGCIYAASVNAAGTLTSKWTELGEAYPLSLLMTQEVVPVVGRTCVTNGLVIGSKTKPAESGGSLTLFDYTVENVARTLQGLVSTRAVSETSLSDSEIVLGKFNEWIDIGTEDLSSVVVKNSGGTVTHVLGTDYQLNTVLGLIKPVQGGAIAEDSTVLVSATGAANTDKRLTIGAGSGTAKIAIKGSLIDDFDAEVHKVYLRMVRLTPTNEVVLLSDPGTEREQLNFDLSPEIPTGQSDYGYIDGLPI